MLKLITKLKRWILSLFVLRPDFTKFCCEIEKEISSHKEECKCKCPHINCNTYLDPDRCEACEKNTLHKFHKSGIKGEDYKMCVYCGTYQDL